MSAFRRIQNTLGAETLPLLGGLALVLVVFTLATPRFMTSANLSSMAFQMPVLGLLTLAMLVPILSGGLNLA
ncbi:MAG: ABC transporter permease, partial [Pseudomonadota bacterium]